MLVWKRRHNTREWSYCALVGIRNDGQTMGNRKNKPTHHHDELVHRSYQRRGQPGFAVDGLGYCVTRDFFLGYIVANGGHAVMITCTETWTVKRMARRGLGAACRHGRRPIQTYLQKRPSVTRCGPRCW